jgi:hypothetical protein
MKIVRKKTGPGQWNADRPKQAYQLALLGATDREIAKVLDVDQTTIDDWKRSRPEFAKALSEGKEAADAKVAEALFKRATGFYSDEVMVSFHKGEVITVPFKKYYPPDTIAATKWLALRRRENWADVTKIESTQTNINITKIDLTGFTAEELRALRKAGLKQLTEGVFSGS